MRVPFEWFLICLSCVPASNSQYITIPPSAQPAGYCNPSVCWQDGSCYCKDQQTGWFSGGGVKVGGCYRIIFPMDCQCDCASSGTACQNTRCHDDVGITKDGQCYSYSLDIQKAEQMLQSQQRGVANTNQLQQQQPFISGSFNLPNPPLVLEISPLDTFASCYKTQVNCQDISGKCGYGASLKGCQRYSPGQCTNCAQPLPANSFWVAQGVCVWAQCDVGMPGYFFQTQCTSTANAVSLPCSQHFGNTDASINQAASMADAQYYCPGQGKALPVPANGRVSSDYTGFVCNPGFYPLGTSCYPCPRGYACPNGVAYECPANYYSSAEQQTSCARCSMSCPFDSDVPLRCGVGSIQDAACVSCSACGTWPHSGLNCVLYDDTVILAQMPVCTPCVNPGTTVAVCVENGCKAM